MLDARRADLEAFLADLLTRRAPSTVASRHKALCVLYKWLEEEEEIDANPMRRIKAPIILEQPVAVVPEDGLRRLLAACAGKDFDARRDTALIMFLLDTGTGRAEARRCTRTSSISIGRWSAAASAMVDRSSVAAANMAPSSGRARTPLPLPEAVL